MSSTAVYVRWDELEQETQEAMIDMADSYHSGVGGDHLPHPCGRIPRLPTLSYTPKANFKLDPVLCPTWYRVDRMTALTTHYSLLTTHYSLLATHY